MAEMTRDQFVEILMAEGFTKEVAEHAYDHHFDPAIEEAQKQEPITRGGVLTMIVEARQNNPNKSTVYKPDFSLSDTVVKLSKELEALKGKIPYDQRKAQEISQQILKIKLNGTITDEDRQAEIDSTLEMPVAELIAQRKKYEKIITECEEKIDDFDVSGAQAKVDALEAQYERKAKNASIYEKSSLYAQYNEDADRIEFEAIKKPLNDLKIKRWEAREHFLVYEARIKYFVLANRELIEAEITAAKREEVRGSLVDLAGYLEEA